MTREEAITYGKRVIDLGLNDETQAFCELAIKALEQAPSNPEKDRKESQDYCAECDHIEMCAWYPTDGCVWLKTDRYNAGYNDAKREIALSGEYERAYQRGFEAGKALEQEACEDWYDVPSNEMTLEQARQAVKDLRKKLAEHLDQEPCPDAISRKSLKHKLEEQHDFFVNAYGGFSNLLPNDKSRVDEITNCIAMVVNEPSVKLQSKTEWIPKGQWIRMSDLSEQEDDRYKCSLCGNVVHHKNKMNLYTFNSWCGRCGSDNRRK